MAEGTCGAYTAIEMGSATDPLISQTVKGQGENNSPGAAPGVANDEESAPKKRQEQQKIQEPKDFLSHFNAIFDDETSNKQEKKKDFETLLNGDDVNLKNIYVQKAFVKMLNDIAKYKEFLELFIERFAAYNERMQTHYVSLFSEGKYPINKAQNMMRDLDAPLHCAVRQLNEDFLQWLLEQGKTEVNLRNKRRETALAILCQKYDSRSMSKLKTRLEDIEKEREKADKMKQIWLDDEKIEVSAKMNNLEENAPTILKLIKMLLVKGAHFNIYMNDGALPFDFLRKYYTKEVLDEIIKKASAESSVAMTEISPKQVNVSTEDKKKLEKRIVQFYKETKDMKVFVTVELLEIFIRFNNFEKFKLYWKGFYVFGHNVKKVITLLLHVAVELKYTHYVEHIIKKASDEIFKLEEIKVTDIEDPTRSVTPERHHIRWCCLTERPKKKHLSLSGSTDELTQEKTIKPQNNRSAEVLSRWCCFKCCKKSSRWCCFKCCQKPHSHTPSEAIELKDLGPDSWNNRAVTPERTPMGAEPTSLCRCFKMFQKKQKLAHHAELKRLLKTVCEKGNNALLNVLLFKINDYELLNEHPLLILTIGKMSKVKENEEIKYFQDCATTLIEYHRKIDMQYTDSNKNTALHLALWYRYDKIASLLLKEGHGLLVLMNKHNLTPIECGTIEFWNTYLDNCISIHDNESELRFDVGFLKPRSKDESSDISKSSSSKYPRCFKHVEDMKPRLTRTVTDMTALRLISQSTDRKEFLLHPVIIAFITIKWKRLCHWTNLNLLLITFTMGTFIAYTLMSCTSGGWKYGVMAGVGAFIILVRETMQMFLLRWSYVTLENVVDIMNVVLIVIVLGCGCDRNGWCEYRPMFSSFLFVSLALQATFLLGATWSNLFITFYMFKTVSSSFFYSFLSFSPVIVAFICSFYQMYSVSNGTESNSSQENFNNFHSAWDAAIKTLVMMTGEFEAANINYDGGKWLLFIAFLFIAPMIILNLINGLAVSDITDIRKESEFICAYKKVRMLERYERAVVESRSSMSAYLQWLFREPFLPSPFFEKHESIIYVMVKEKNKLAIKSKTKENTKEDIPGFLWLPSWFLKYYIGIRSIQLIPLPLKQSYVDKAKTIARRQSKKNWGRVTNELAEMEQTDKPALVFKIATNQHNTIALSRSGTGPSVPDSRDKQIEMLQVQVRSMIAMLTDIQQQLSGSHASKAESTARTSGDHSRVQ